MQQQNEVYKKLSDYLKSASALLDLEGKSQLYQDIIAISTHLANPSFRIAVFAPFNHGKSTLLNAMLGNRTLPIDLIPTTGAAITVKYGTELQTRIILVDGTEINHSGTEILKEFAILDNNRQMRKDVASVEVFCPHPLLETGVEFIDLPGTNDREEQDNLVKEQLLSADLVIQLLDARKLMTLGERENLRDWLLDRGIKTVIFVANFLNLLEPDEQKQVHIRLLFVAESFRAELPPGFSNLYRVDALPALRARLKGNVAEASSSGLVAFESALENIVGILQQNRGGVRLPRVQAIASQILQLFKGKIDPIASEIKSIDDKNNAKIEIKQKAEKLIIKGFNTSVADLRNWLSLPSLLTKYQTDAAVALAENNFKHWQINTFKKDLTELELAVGKWLYQAYEFFQEERPEDLLIPFPSVPQITLPPKPSNSDDLSETGSIAVGSGIGWLLGGPVGAAVVGSISYILNKNIQKEDEKSATESYHQQVAQICIVAAEDYLSSFSSQGLSILAKYENKADKVIKFKVGKEPVEIAKKREYLHNLQTKFNQLLQELETANISSNYQPYTEIPKYTDVKKESQTYSKKNITDKQINFNYSSHQDNTTQNSATRAKPPHQQVSSPPPSPPPNPEQVEAQFRTWELDEEIAQMKAKMGSTGKQQNKTQSNKPEAEKDKKSRAYATLEVQPNASFAEVKQAYRILVKKWHPDLFIDKLQLQKEAQEKMRLINEAYTILSQQK
ncbi:MAG: dynamin family protein [Hassallia sp. WJT32-NPBG1]|jgi:replication fork clamp-binding protein CrfC|nr:dynamin family protein [Hassallia sp. WJT32-NPBG1]